MTRLRIMSDLHLEFGPLDLEPVGEDVLVLAGDIGLYTDGAAWALEYARRTSIPVVIVTTSSTVDGSLVVVTHHLPSARSVALEYAGEPTNVAYASNLDDLVEASEAVLWIHGHTHNSFNYQIGKTRVLCNPRGYYSDGVNPQFDQNLVVEV